MKDTVKLSGFGFGLFAIIILMLVVVSYAGFKINRWFNWKFGYESLVNQKMEQVNQKINQLEKRVEFLEKGNK